MSQSRKRRGRESEAIVAQYLRDNGFPHAERRPASLQGSDIDGIPSVDVEVKARRGLDLTGLVRQMAARGGRVQVGVIRPDGAGPTTVHQWPVVMTLAQAVALLREAGHGEPPAPQTVTLGAGVPTITGSCACGRPDLPHLVHGSTCSEADDD